ncbi:MAG TPA: hypothetical protein VFD70_20510 [Anaerolineae bacterium]|nr:hypothetical protein [Anaerolineae bacterium]
MLISTQTKNPKPMHGLGFFVQSDYNAFTPANPCTNHMLTALLNQFERRPHLWILLAYSFLTIGFTYPLAWNIGTAFPGLAPDTFLFIWNLEWLQRAIFEYGTNPYFTTDIYYPTGVSLYFHTVVPGNFFLGLPIQFAFGSSVAYMLFTLVSFVLSGYSAYLLAFDAVKKHGPAFLAGLIFTFSPYHLSHLNYAHFNLIALQWLPFFALAAIKYLQRPTLPRLILSIIFFSGVTLTDWYYALYATIFLGLLTLYQIIRARSFRPLLSAIILGGVYVLLFSPLFLGMAGEIGRGGIDTARALKEADRFSGDLLGFVVPSSLQAIWGLTVRPLAETFNGGIAERSIFFGYLPLLLAAWAVIKLRAQVLFWLLTALVFSLLALGPTLHIAGETEFGAQHLKIILPQALLYQLPFISSIFNAARSISRYSLIALLCIAIMAAYGLDALTATRPLQQKFAMIAAACLIVGIEFVVMPIPITPIVVPPLFQAWRNDPAQFAVMDLPTDYKSGGEGMYFWTIHHKPSTNGYHSQLLAFPLLTALPSLTGKNANDILLEPRLKPAELFQFFNIRYVILHKQAPDETRFVRQTGQWIRNVLGAKQPITQDDNIAVFAAPNAPLPPLVVILDQSTNTPRLGWEPPESTETAHPSRWMRNDAGILIYTRSPQTATIRMNAISLVQPRELQLFLNNNLIATQTIHPNQQTPVSLSLPLQSGLNRLRLHSVQPPEQPSALGLNNDPRFLSISFSDLYITPQK